MRYQAHNSPHPHLGGCLGCREAKVCSQCGQPWGRNHCTNGRCAACHMTVCGEGGAREPGHGYFREPLKLSGNMRTVEIDRATGEALVEGDDHAEE